MRHVHGKRDGVGGVESFEAVLGMQGLDCLDHTGVVLELHLYSEQVHAPGVLAVEQLHALLHNVQGSDDGVVGDCGTSARKHVPENLVAVAAALEGLLAQLVNSKI